MTLSKKDSNPVYDIIYGFKLLLLRRGYNSETAEPVPRPMLSKLRSIFGSKAVAEVFTYFCLHGAASAWVLQCRLKMTEPTAYRAMKTLRSLGFIQPAIKVQHQKRSRGGPRPVIYVLEGADKGSVAKALKIHNKMLSPKFRMAEQVANKIFEDYKEAGKLEINYTEIVRQIKILRLPFRGSDIPELAARYLHEKGMKVWR